jgi:DDE superfamily endonuclease
VIIDNLPAHKAIGNRGAIQARGATFRYLPKYSPDLNSMEMPSKLSQPNTNDQISANKMFAGRW